MGNQFNVHPLSSFFSSSPAVSPCPVQIRVHLLGVVVLNLTSFEMRKQANLMLTIQRYFKFNKCSFVLEKERLTALLPCVPLFAAPFIRCLRMGESRTCEVCLSLGWSSHKQLQATSSHHSTKIINSGILQDHPLRTKNGCSFPHWETQFYILHKPI